MDEQVVNEDAPGLDMVATPQLKTRPSLISPRLSTTNVTESSQKALPTASSLEIEASLANIPTAIERARAKAAAQVSDEPTERYHARRNAAQGAVVRRLETQIALRRAQLSATANKHRDSSYELSI